MALVALRALERSTRRRDGARQPPRCATGSRRVPPDVDGDRGRRAAGARRGLPARLAPVGGRAPDAGAARGRAALRPDVLTGYGLRTLSEGHPQFDPTPTTAAAVWPFDSWIGWGGLRAAGFEREAERVRTGVLAALERLGGA